MKYSDLKDEWALHWYQFILNNIDKELDWDYIAEYPNITWEIIRNNLDKPWDWEYLTVNKYITMDIIQNNLDMPWEWYLIF